jgi:sn-glycerol 3-phosphate transport system permease protein
MGEENSLAPRSAQVVRTVLRIETSTRYARPETISRLRDSGPARILVPMTRTPIAALFVIQFIYGLNQYLWPLLITTKEKYYTLVIGINRMLAGADNQIEWQIVMATVMLAMLPPVIVVIGMQRQFVAGMTDTEK